MALSEREIGKRQRLMNLTICLLAANRPLSREEIRRAVTDYPQAGSQEAFLRMFERDKTELRSAGIVLETGDSAGQSEGEDLYFIRRSEALLPHLSFTSDEATVLALAGRAWLNSTMGEATQRALGKLRALGADPDPERLAALAAVIAPGLDVPAVFEPIAAAHRSGLRVHFGYHGKARTLEPWAVSSRHGVWYVLGWDVDHGEQRTYRLNRIEGVPTLGAPATTPIPSDFDASAVIACLGAAEIHRARVAIEGEHAPQLRRAAQPLDEPAPWPGYVLYDVDYGREQDFVGLIAAAGEHAVVLDPPEIVAAVVAHLRAVMDGADR